MSEDEVGRAKSSNGVDAVIVERNGGATTSFLYKIYVVNGGQHYEKGELVASLYGAERNSTPSGIAYGANLVWRRPDLLVVEYLSARDTRIVHPTVDVANHRIAVELRGGVKDPKAPLGGMESNSSQQQR